MVSVDLDIKDIKTAMGIYSSELISKEKCKKILSEFTKDQLIDYLISSGHSLSSEDQEEIF